MWHKILGIFSFIASLLRVSIKCFIHLFRNVFLSAFEILNWCYMFIKVACVPFFENCSWLHTMIAVSALCKRPANALQTPRESVEAPWDRGDRRGSSVWSLWVRKGINDIRCRRSANAVDVPWGRSRDTVTSPYTLWGRRANATAYSGDHVRPCCVHMASSWHSRRPHCAVTALPLRTQGVPTALIQIAVGKPSHGAHFVHAQNARHGMAS